MLARQAKYHRRSHDLHGEGIMDVYRKVRTKVSDAIDSIKGFLTGPRSNIPPPSRRMLAAHGDDPLVSLLVCRVPVIPAIQRVMNWLSLGQINRATRAAGYDQLFHLYLLARTNKGQYVRVEKNETINIVRAPGPKGEMRVVPLPTDRAVTLNEMMAKGAQLMGPRFFIYDSITNNCQVFVLSLLQASGLHTDTAFIKQPAAEIVPKYLHGPSRAITDIASRASYLLHGRGVTPAARQWPAISVVSVHFRKSQGWTSVKARRWLEQHKLQRTGPVRATATELAYALRPPSGPTRAKTLAGGIRLVMDAAR